MKDAINRIARIDLFPENGQKDLGIERIELVQIFYHDGSSEYDNSSGFEFSYHENDRESFETMINQIAHKYGVLSDMININFPEE